MSAVYTVGRILEALTAIGLPVVERNLYAWRHRVGLRLEGGEAGRYQLFTDRDGIRVATMALLVAGGMAPRHAAAAINGTLPFWEPGGELYLLLTMIPDKWQGVQYRSFPTMKDVEIALNPSPEHDCIGLYPPDSIQVVAVHRIAAKLLAKLTPAAAAGAIEEN